jgi:chaperonin GroEL
MLLCYEMVNGGYEAVAKELMLPDVISGMEYAVEKAIAYIQKQKDVLNQDGIPNVAKTAGGRAIAGLVADAFAKAKPDGVLMVEEANAPDKSSVEIQEGIIFNQGYLADEFANDPETGNCVFNDCFILVSEGTINASKEFISVLNKIAKAQKPVLILSEDISTRAEIG